MPSFCSASRPEARNAFTITRSELTMFVMLSRFPVAEGSPRFLCEAIVGALQQKLPITFYKASRKIIFFFQNFSARPQPHVSFFAKFPRGR
jgi:hypothetical protein